jgi:putative peptide zinc metalloprotease protein
VINLVINVYRIIAAPRAEPMSFPKVAITLTLLCCLLVGGLTIPLPLHVESVFLIEPHQVQHVFTSTPGRLTRFEAEPGQPVSQGQLLAVLSNPEQEDAIRALEVRKRVQKANVDLQHELDDLARERLAAEKLRSIEKQLADLKEQTRHLEIRAPCEGVVVAPPRLAEPKLDVAHHELSTWFGTPLETRNLGCYFDERTHLLSIAPSDRLNAILIIDQGDRNDILVGQTVEIKFDSLPDQTYRGKVKEISERDLEFVPKTLSNKLGGELPTVTDDQGRERLTSNAYQATVQLERDTRLLRPGMRGRARFVVDRRPAGDWIWRYLRRTFHFRL